MPNTRGYSGTQSVHYFSFPPRPTFPRVLQLSRHDPIGLFVVAQAEQPPRPRQPRRAHACFDTLTSSSLERIGVGDNAVVRRFAPVSQDSKQHYVVCSKDTFVVALKKGSCRTSVEESLYYLGFHHPGILLASGAADLPWLRAVVQLPRVTPGAHPPGTDSPVNLGRQVWCFSDGASQIGERGYLALPVPRGVEDYLRFRCTRNGHAHGIRLALRDGQTRCIKDFNGDHHHPLQPGWRPRHDCTSRQHKVHPKSHAAHIPISFQGQPSPAALEDGQDLRVCPRPRLSTTRSIAAKKTLNSSGGKHSSLTRPLVPSWTTPIVRHHYPARKLSSQRGIGGLLLSSVVVFRIERAPAKEVCDRQSRRPSAGRWNTETAARALSFPTFVTCAPRTSYSSLSDASGVGALLLQQQPLRLAVGAESWKEPHPRVLRMRSRGSSRIRSCPTFCAHFYHGISPPLRYIPLVLHRPLGEPFDDVESELVRFRVEKGAQEPRPHPEYKP